MNKTNPIAKPKARRWYLEHHLPCNELVLLDGIPGVGKSLYLARITKWLTDDIPELKPSVPVLLITSPRQEELLAEQQESQWPSTEHFQHLSFSDITTSATSLADYLAALVTTLEVHKPQVMILDSLEDLLADFTQADGKAPTPKEFTCFWSELAELAKSQSCTIIVTRQHGMHQSRSYGTFTKTGSAIARFILTMHYHPIDARKRVLTTIKNQFGLAGQQVHLSISNTGEAYIKLPHQHEHVRPSKSPATWMSDPSVSSEDSEIIELVTSIIGDEPTPKDGLKEAVTTMYSNRAYHRVMSRMKLPTIRDPKTLTWYWLPSNIMRMEAKEKQARTATVGVPPSGGNASDNQHDSSEKQKPNAGRLKPVLQQDSILTRFFKRKQDHKNAS